MLTGYGLKITINNYLTERVQFRKHRKSRINKKWAKNPKNWRDVPKMVAYQIGDTLTMHPAVLDKLNKVIEQRNVAMMDSLYALPNKNSNCHVNTYDFNINSLLELKEEFMSNKPEQCDFNNFKYTEHYTNIFPAYSSRMLINTTTF